eukprot:CAMPEP_0205962162 /NCGR_PEP_ID=MMETSP1459-20131121/70455_1 /ASSEMBLY_ACC=CAM_ASM_001120 /TAXON_ID=41880 /ORGANISM="Pycnococcus provasolii, Strain RCC931" /LENGTH=261 /DNA_ID=CAMNT_0053334931 /DNA_START=44 /DNA_END=831 /DNA_ORIENTATION=+
MCVQIPYELVVQLPSRSFDERKARQQEWLLVIRSACQSAVRQRADRPASALDVNRAEHSVGRGSELLTVRDALRDRRGHNELRTSTPTHNAALQVVVQLPSRSFDERKARQQEWLLVIRSACQSAVRQRADRPASALDVNRAEHSVGRGSELLTVRDALRDRRGHNELRTSTPTHNAALQVLYGRPSETRERVFWPALRTVSGAPRTPAFDRRNEVKHLGVILREIVSFNASACVALRRLSAPASVSQSPNGCSLTFDGAL